MQAADERGAPAPVLAVAAASSAAYRRQWAAEWVRERFWVVPAALLAAGTGLAVLVTGDDGFWGSWGALSADPDWSSGFLESIAGATLTFLGVVFTLSLVALQLASSQLSPRMIRMFVRSPVTRVAFGTLLAAFSFTVTALVISHGQDGRAASRAVVVTAALVAVSLIVFLAYVASMMRLLQVVDVIGAVSRQTRAAVAACWLPPPGSRAAAPPAWSPRPAQLRLPPDVTSGAAARRLAGRARHGRAPGRVLGVDRARLAELGRRHDCVIELTVRMGEYVPRGAPFAVVHYRAPAPGPGEPGDGPGGPPCPVPAAAVAAAVHFGRGRTLYQDPAFGLRQLADIAAQALSPAVNQPTTAVLVIDALQDVLLLVARSPRPSGCYTGRDGVVRLVVPVPGWEDCLDLAFTEITTYGASSPQVARRLLAAYGALEEAAPAGEREAVSARRQELARLLGAQGRTGQALRADPMGLG